MEKLINSDHFSYEEIGRRFGCSGTTVKKQAEKLGINLTSRRKINPKETFNKGKRISSKMKYCPNCDSQLDTFKSKNKNGERYYLKKYYGYNKTDAERLMNLDKLNNNRNDQSDISNSD